jgi:hypothetical protein
MSRESALVCSSIRPPVRALLTWTCITSGHNPDAISLFLVVHRKETTVSSAASNGKPPTVCVKSYFATVVHRLFNFPLIDAMLRDVVEVAVVPLEHLVSSYRTVASRITLAALAP